MSSNRIATSSPTAPSSEESSFRTRYSMLNWQASFGSSASTDFRVRMEEGPSLHHGSGLALPASTNTASATMMASAGAFGNHFKPYPHFSELPDDLALEYGATSLFDSAHSRRSRSTSALRDMQDVPTPEYCGRPNTEMDLSQARRDSINPAERSRSEAYSNLGAMPATRMRTATTMYYDRGCAHIRSASSSISSNPSVLDRLLRTPPRTRRSHNNDDRIPNRDQQERQQAWLSGSRNTTNNAITCMDTTTCTPGPPPLEFPSNLTVSSAFARQRATHFGSHGTMNVAAADRNRMYRSVPSPVLDEDNNHEQRFYQDRIRPTTSTQARSSSYSINGPPQNIVVLPSPAPVEEKVADDLDVLANLYPKKGTRSYSKSLSSSSSSCVDDGKLPAQSNKDKTAPKYPNTVLVEISPGTRVPLRGAVETLDAVRIDFYAPGTCMVCDALSNPAGSSEGAVGPMFCIQDAAYVLCPVCKSISPFADQGYGVGLGFTLDVLAEMQEQIYRERTPCPVARLAQPTDEDNF